jgi:two-component system alkaline phosphatase synthesis response regulator PhoP
VVLDANLPDGDGFEICRAAREEGLKTPVIMLTARTRDEDITQGFAVGADDYVTKPFNATLLLARIGSVLRRTGPVAPESLALEELKVGAVTLEPQSQEFVHRNRRAKLTPTEFRLLHLLLSNRNKVLKSDTIVERVWGRDGAAAESGSLKSHVRHLREKVEVNPSLPELIVTVPGVGYMARVAE